MKIATRLLFLVVGIGIGLWVWGRLFPDPQAVIRQRLNKLAELCSYTGKEGNIARALSVDKFGGYFADHLEIEVNLPGMPAHETIDTRDELKQAMFAIRSSVNSIQAELLDMTVEIAPGKESALARFTLNATMNGEKNAVLETFELTLKKIDGNWVITRVQNIKALK